jgi:hypothetical protein
VLDSGGENAGSDGDMLGGHFSEESGGCSSFQKKRSRRIMDAACPNLDGLPELVRADVMHQYERERMKDVKFG